MLLSKMDFSRPLLEVEMAQDNENPCSYSCYVCVCVCVCVCVRACVRVCVYV